MNNTDVDDFPNHMLYAMYKGAGPVSALILPAVLMNVAGVPGILSNMLLILVTIRNKSLRGSTNFLLALTALFEILHQSTHFVFLFVTVSGLNFVPYYLALRFQLHSIFGVLAAQMAMMATALDRFISVVIPMSYAQINGVCYLTLLTLASVGSGLFIAVWTWNFSLTHPYLPVTGYISDLLVLDVEIIFLCIQVMCAVNILLYLLVWLFVRSSIIGGGPASQQHPNQAKLFKSLVVIVVVVIGGYVLNNICRLVVNHYFHLDDVQQWTVAVFGGLLLNIGASAETPTLYIISTEYRRTINKELAWLFCCRKSSSVTPTNVANVAMATISNNLRRVKPLPMVAGQLSGTPWIGSVDIDVRRHSQLSAMSCPQPQQRRKSMAPFGG